MVLPCLEVVCAEKFSLFFLQGSLAKRRILHFPQKRVSIYSNVTWVQKFQTKICCLQQTRLIYELRELACTPRMRYICNIKHWFQQTRKISLRPEITVPHLQWVKKYFENLLTANVTREHHQMKSSETITRLSIKVSVTFFCCTVIREVGFHSQSHGSLHWKCAKKIRIYLTYWTVLQRRKTELRVFKQQWKASRPKNPWETRICSCFLFETFGILALKFYSNRRTNISSLRVNGNR